MDDLAGPLDWALPKLENAPSKQRKSALARTNWDIPSDFLRRLGYRLSSELLVGSLVSGCPPNPDLRRWLMAEAPTAAATNEFPRIRWLGASLEGIPRCFVLRR